MADPKKVEIFKQYLIDTKAFQTLAETLSLLNSIEPKPNDAMQFIRKRMSVPIDAEEFRYMKQTLGKLNADMGQMKADMTKISNMVSKLLPNHPTNVDQCENVSVHSLQNNVGDTSHISMLDDSSLIFDQSADNLNSTMHTVDEPQLDCTDSDVVNTSQSKDAHNNSVQGFTVEFVEVDVVNKSSLDISSQEYKTVDEIQIDENVLDELVTTSTPNETITTMEKSSNAHLAGLNIEELPIVFKEENSEEQLSISQDFHGFDSQDVEESKMHLPAAKIDEPVTLKEKPDEETVQVNIEPEVIIEPKNEQVASEVACTDDENTEVENVNESQDEPSNDAPKESQVNAFKESEVPITSELPIESQELTKSEVLTEHDVSAANPTEEKRSIVEGILDKVVEVVMGVGENGNMTDVVITPVDGPKVETIDIVKSVAKNDDVCAAMMKDDAETQLFLSYS